jgi:hypothetical protein
MIQIKRMTLAVCARLGTVLICTAAHRFGGVRAS